MNQLARHGVVRKAGLVVVVMSLFLFTGCIGIYNNKDLFELKPQEGKTTELELLKTWGTPAFAGTIGESTIYTYKVRDNMYIVLVGLFEGYDLVVRCEDGTVAEVTRVERPKAFSLFQPWIWADTE